MNKQLRILSAAVIASLAVALAACPGKGPSAIMPTLPGDGTANVSKPAATRQGEADPWADADLLTPPAATPPQRIALPAEKRFTLANGLEVIVVESSRVPVVSMVLAVKAGRADEPSAKRGVSELTGNMLVKGSKKRNAQALAKAIEFVGASLTVDTSHEATLIGCHVLGRDLGTCLSAVPEILLQPAFPADELTKMRNQLASALRARRENAAAVASAHVQNLLWGDDHVRGWVSEEPDFEQLTVRDLAAWHKAWFHPNNAVLMVAGAVDPKKLQADLNRAFAPWKKAALPPHPKFVAQSLSGVRIRLVDKPGQPQTHIRIGQFGIAHDDPRYYAMTVWNHALGGGQASSRLIQAMRTGGGKAVGASTSFDRNLERGSFVAETFTRTADTVAATKLVLAEIAKMAKSGPTDEEVKAAIANITGTYSMRFQSARDVASALLAAELHGFNANFVAEFPIKIAEVTAAAAAAAAREVLDPQNFVVVFVGDAKEIEGQLKAEGWRYQKVAHTDLIGRRERVLPPVDAKAESAARVLLDGALATKGGAKRLSAIKSLSMTANGEASEKGQKFAVEISRTLVIPDKTRVDIKLPANGVSISIAIDGAVGWQRGPDPNTGKLAIVDVPASELPAIEADRWREPELVLLRHREAGAKVRPLPDDPSGRAVIRVTSADESRSVDLAIDKKTKQLAGMAYVTDGVPTVDEFSDYRAVSGLQVAHKRVSRGGGRSTEYSLTKVVVDGPVDPGLFKKPSE